MQHRNLPPLEVGTQYRLQDFEGFEYTGLPLAQGLLKEDKAILHLHLANGTRLDAPASDEMLHFLLRNLISAFPVETLKFLKTQPWCPENVKTWEPEK